MSDANDELPNDHLLAEIVHGDELNVPFDVEEVGPWAHTGEGEEYRELKFPPLYEHPWGAGTAGLIGRQGRNGRVLLGIQVNVAAELSTDEADRLRAALVDLIDNVNRNNEGLEEACGRPGGTDCRSVAVFATQQSSVRRPKRF
ncbi:MAG: hypothetical protein JST91_28225 [Actinobacteria bacterium]|nr:hypothetical protein [Actinomycetota bacterium]